MHGEETGKERKRKQVRHGQVINYIRCQNEWLGASAKLSTTNKVTEQVFFSFFSSTRSSDWTTGSLTMVKFSSQQEKNWRSGPLLQSHPLLGMIKWIDDHSWISLLFLVLFSHFFRSLSLFLSFQRTQTHSSNSWVNPTIRTDHSTRTCDHLMDYLCEASILCVLSIGSLYHQMSACTWGHRLRKREWEWDWVCDEAKYFRQVRNIDPFTYSQLEHK